MANVSGIEEIKQFVPTKSSKSAEWIAYWNILKKRYGKTIATGVFAKTWKMRKGKDADVVLIRKETGVPLDNESVLDSISQVKTDALGVFDSMGTGIKIAVYITGGLVFLLVGGVIVRIITASAKEIGTATGVAAKVYTGKP